MFYLIKVLVTKLFLLCLLLFKYHNTFSREPESIVKPAKPGKPEEDNRYNEQIEKAKSKAVRHLFLIRHGQYNLDGATDKERVLTELGRRNLGLNNYHS